jgi:co-chaperonin GroES (HSP10)
MNLTVIGPRVFVRPDKMPEQTESGLHMIHDRQQCTMVGTVIALGDGPVTSKGVRLEHFVNVGERVLFSPDAGQEVIFEKDVLISIDEAAILAVVE